MAEAKSIVKQQLQAMTEMKERVDKYGHLLDPEDQAFLSEQVDLSHKKCRLYMEMEEAIQKGEKAKKEPVKKDEPVKEEPKKKAAPKKKKEDTQVPLITEEAPAPEPAPEPVPAPAPEPDPAMEPVPEEDLSLDDLLG